jgi:hypothetical protein
LVSIANRKRELRAVGWGSGIHYKDDSASFECYICHIMVEVGSSSGLTTQRLCIEHGMKHLKEHNLLPFI